MNEWHGHARHFEALTHQKSPHRLLLVFPFPVSPTSSPQTLISKKTSIIGFQSSSSSLWLYAWQMFHEHPPKNDWNPLFFVIPCLFNDVAQNLRLFIGWRVCWRPPFMTMEHAMVPYATHSGGGLERVGLGWVFYATTRWLLWAPIWLTSNDNLWSKLLGTLIEVHHSFQGRKLLWVTILRPWK